MQVIRPLCSVAVAIMAVAVVDSATLVAPPAFRPDSSGVTHVTVTVDVATINMDSAGTFNTRAYHINGVPAFPGPTIFLQPGGYLNFTLINNLGANSAADLARAHNEYRHVNTTNIHTHGLHVDAHVDNIFRKAEPGATLNYWMHIVPQHHPGTHWYHAHHHGSSNLQMMGGLLGMLIVNPASTITIPTEIASLTEEIMVIHPMKFGDSSGEQDCSRDEANHQVFKIWSFSELETTIGSSVRASESLTSGTPNQFYLVNGMRMPTINFAPGQSKVFRTVYGAGFGQVFLEITGSSCTMTIIAIDGVYLDTPRTATTIHYVPASRYDFVVTCSTAGTFNIRNSNNFFAQGNFATISVSGTATSSASVPSSLTSITKPYYLQDVRSSTVDTTHEVDMGQGGADRCKFVMGEGTNCGGRGTTTCPHSSFAGERGTTAADESKYSHVTTVGQVNQWQVHSGGRQPHPLHIHVNHFVITSFTTGMDGAQLSDYGLQTGEWRDTIPILSGTTTIKFQAHTFAGETVMHCHILSHEDRGFMSTFLIKSPAGGTPVPASTIANSASTASPGVTFAPTAAPAIVTPAPIGTTPAPLTVSSGATATSFALALLAVTLILAFF